MNSHRHPSNTSASRRPQAFTLAEMLVSMGIGSMVLGVVAMLSIFSARSFVGIGNYMDLDRTSRNALDLVTKDVRQTIALTSYATNRLVFRDYDSNTLTFAWDAGTRQLTRTKDGATKVLLTQCDYLKFNICQRNPIPGVFDFYPATNAPGIYAPNLCKLVDVTWRCSRSMLGRQFHTESVQTAKIVLRN